MQDDLLSEITCPYCNKSIPLDSALTKTIKEKMQKQIEQEILQQTNKSFEGTIQDLKNQISEKDELLKKTQTEELQLRSDRRKLQDEVQSFDLKLQRTLDEERGRLIETTLKQANEEHRLKSLEKDKQIDDMKITIEELQRKAEQGSMKNQGEVFELEMERILKESFVNDKVDPVPSGVSGADILHTVCSKTGKICGKILIESKNTKNWSNQWIPKLREDQRNVQADIAVLVTTALPDGVSHFHYLDGVYVVHCSAFIPVIILLRIQLSEVAKMKNFNVNMDEKKELLYNYLTSLEFRQKVESVIEAFGNMMIDLDKEKKAMIKTWAKREKQIQQAAHGLAKMYGGFQGIVGSSLPEISVLSLPETNDDKNEENPK